MGRALRRPIPDEVGAGMNHFCHCSHLPRDHYADTGHCEAIEPTLWGEERCTCPAYEHDSEDT